MSNGFFFIPTDLYNQMAEQADGDIGGYLKAVIEAFIAAPKAKQLARLRAYTPTNESETVCIVSDEHGLGYREFWQPLSLATLLLTEAGATGEEHVIAAALYHQFNPLSRAPLKDRAAMMTPSEIRAELGFDAPRSEPRNTQQHRQLTRKLRL